jgi:hypothetical protein
MCSLWCGAARWGPAGRWSSTSSAVAQHTGSSQTGSPLAYQFRNPRPTHWPASCSLTAACTFSSIPPPAPAPTIDTASATRAQRRVNRLAQLVPNDAAETGTHPLAPTGSDRMLLRRRRDRYEIGRARHLSALATPVGPSPSAEPVSPQGIDGVGRATLPSHTPGTCAETETPADRNDGCIRGVPLVICL